MNQNKHTLYVYFNAFWLGFTASKKTQEFFTRLLSLTFDTDIEITSDVNQAELLVESGFGASILATKSWRASVLFMGESWLRENWRDYTVVLSGQSPADGPNIIPCPLYFLYLYDTAPNNGIIPNVTRPMPNQDVVVIVSNSDKSVRTQFLDELDKHFCVTYAGKYKNNVGGPLAAAYGSKEFFLYVSKFKFVITMENSAQDSYITEKIFHGFFSHNVPVYWGAPSVTDYINKERFLHVRDGTPDEFARVISEMKLISANESAWQSIIAQPWEAREQPQPTLESLATQIKIRLQ